MKDIGSIMGLLKKKISLDDFQVVEESITNEKQKPLVAAIFVTSHY